MTSLITPEKFPQFRSKCLIHKGVDNRVDDIVQEVHVKYNDRSVYDFQRDQPGG